MKKRVKIWLIIGIIIALIVIGIIIFVLKHQGFSFPDMDYSAGSGIGQNIGKVTDTNAFDKLNPFR